MGLFDSVTNFATGTVKGFTTGDWSGLFDNMGGVNYNDLFQSQLAIYNQQIAERNRLANATDVQNANLASTTILTGGSRPAASTTPLGNDLSARTASDAAVQGINTVLNPTGAQTSTQGLTGDSLALQQQRNKQATEDFMRSLRLSDVRLF